MLYLLLLPALYLVQLYLRRYTIYNDGKPYMTRYYLVGKKWYRKLFNKAHYLHHFHSSDGREYHSHRWTWAITRILFGGYVEYRIDLKFPKLITKFLMLRGQSNMLTSDTFHRVELLDEHWGVWTLFTAGPHDKTKSDWGFLRADGTVEYAKDRFKGKRDALSDD